MKETGTALELFERLRRSKGGELLASGMSEDAARRIHSELMRGAGVLAGIPKPLPLGRYQMTTTPDGLRLKILKSLEDIDAISAHRDGETFKDEDGQTWAKCWVRLADFGAGVDQ